MSGHIFITGASGFIGGAIARALAADHAVYAMSRGASSDEKVKANNATPVRCDLDTICAEHLAGCDTVIHVAAHVSPWGSKQEFWQSNVVGTENILRAAQQAGIKRFVHMSTESVAWHGQHMRNIDETEPYAESTPYLYASTKREAEKRVLAANGQGGMQVVVMRPRWVWGAGDQALIPEFIGMLERGEFLWIDHGKYKTSTVHIDNLVHAVKLALEKMPAGECYFVTDGEQPTYHEFLTAVLGAYGFNLPEKSLPSWLARSAAFVVEGVWRTLGIERQPPMTRHAIDLISGEGTLNDAKARRDLGYRPVVTVEEGIQQLVASSTA
jgi:nucleoside-diphosphate-sugar epimerase